MTESTKSAIIGSVVAAVVGVVLTAVLDQLRNVDLNWIDFALKATVVIVVSSLVFALVFSIRAKNAAEKKAAYLQARLEQQTYHANENLEKQIDDACKELNERLKQAEDKLQSKKDLLSRYEKMGIVDCTDYLKGTELEPMECMPRVRRSLSFLGVGGNKWVAGHEERESFKRMLARVRSHRGTVRFLIIDPTGEGYQDLAKLRGADAIPVDSYKTFYAFAQKYECLEVKLYDHLPSFRLQFVDNRYLAASRYYFERERHSKFSGGWKIPHVIVRAETTSPNQEPQHMGSLYESFEQLFDYLWLNSEPIEKLKGTKFGDD